MATTNDTSADPRSSQHPKGDASRREPRASKRRRDAQRRSDATREREEAQQSAFAASKPAKDHVSAGLLAIFLGALGMHKFYLGYSNAGFLMLAVSVCLAPFTFGISAVSMAVLGIVEGVMYLSTSQQRFEYVYVQNQREWL